MIEQSGKVFESSETAVQCLRVTTPIPPALSISFPQRTLHS